MVGVTQIIVYSSKEAKNGTGWGCSEKHQLLARLNSLLTTKQKKQLVSYELPSTSKWGD